MRAASGGRQLAWERPRAVRWPAKPRMSLTRSSPRPAGADAPVQRAPAGHARVSAGAGVGHIELEDAQPPPQVLVPRHSGGPPAHHAEPQQVLRAAERGGHSGQDGHRQVLQRRRATRRQRQRPRKARVDDDIPADACERWRRRGAAFKERRRRWRASGSAGWVLAGWQSAARRRRRRRLRILRTVAGTAQRRRGERRQRGGAPRRGGRHGRCRRERRRSAAFAPRLRARLFCVPIARACDPRAQACALCVRARSTARVEHVENHEKQKKTGSPRRTGAHRTRTDAAARALDSGSCELLASAPFSCACLRDWLRRATRLSPPQQLGRPQPRAAPRSSQPLQLLEYLPGCA